MMSIEDAKHFIRLCNLAEDWDNYGLWHGAAHRLCGDNCPECTTPQTLKAIFPELEGYEEFATAADLEQEIKNMPNNKHLTNALATLRGGK